MVTATGSIRASGAHAATTPTRPKTIRPQPDAHETSPCSRVFSSPSLMHLCSGKRCIIAPALTVAKNITVANYGDTLAGLRIDNKAVEHVFIAVEHVFCSACPM